MVCHSCTRYVRKRPSNAVNGRTGRPWKHAFCNAKCYAEWRRKRHLHFKARKLKFQRNVWGTTGIGRRRPKHIGAWGRRAERTALIVLPKLGFSGIYDASRLSNQFFVDFIATRNGRRALVDVTIRMKAYRIK